MNKWTMILAAVALWGLGDGTALAAEVRSAGKAVAVVPFAVPVAVPVAVVQSPVALYAYSRYVPPPVPTRGVEPLQSTPARERAEPHRAAAAELLTRRCGECHTGSDALAGFSLLESSGVLRVALPRQRVLRSVSSAEGQPPRMPPEGRVPLSVEELELLRRWAEPPLDLEY